MKVKTHEDQARLALGLEPVATSADKDGKAAEKAKRMVHLEKGVLVD